MPIQTEEKTPDEVPSTPPPPSKTTDAPVEEAGLIAKGERVPLRAVHVSAKLLDMVNLPLFLFHHFASLL